MFEYNPCQGYDAAISYLALHIENYANQTHTTFDNLLNQNSIWVNDKIQHIANKYGYTYDHIVETLIDMHKSWE